VLLLKKVKKGKQMDKKPLMTKAEFLEWQQDFVESMSKFWNESRKEAEERVWEVTKKHFSKDNWKNCKYILVD
jgi:hypothetical protein